jgi:succinate dehydrogenase / fumarate reductase cytochrome b subunit
MWQSQVGKKVLTGITGIGLTLFVLIHMSGNLSYFTGTDAYNTYSHFLMGLGPLFYAIELGLLAFFLFHIVMGVSIALKKRQARTTGYRKFKSAGGPSKQSLSSRSMIVTGLIIMVFLVIHLMSFKYGAYYTTTVDGEPMRDLARLLTEKFHSPWYAFGYTGVMILLGIHLRHGVWSAFQSLGAVSPRLTPLVYFLGAVLGILIAVGFLVLPLWIFFTGGNA